MDTLTTLLIASSISRREIDSARPWAPVTTPTDRTPRTHTARRLIATGLHRAARAIAPPSVRSGEQANVTCP